MTHKNRPFGTKGEIMPKYFVKNEQINQNQIDILGQDVNHIKNVLRMRIGDTLELCNCDTQENYNCEIVNIEKKKNTM